jgi:hypothetical protein
MTPFLSYFMMLLWAALIGDTFDVEEDSMLTEWVICMQIYVAMVLLYNLKKVLKYGK